MKQIATFISKTLSTVA